MKGIQSLNQLLQKSTPTGKVELIGSNTKTIKPTQLAKVKDAVLTFNGESYDILLFDCFLGLDERTFTLKNSTFNETLCFRADDITCLKMICLIYYTNREQFLFGTAAVDTTNVGVDFPTMSLPTFHQGNSQPNAQTNTQAQANTPKNISARDQIRRKNEDDIKKTLSTILPTGIINDEKFVNAFVASIENGSIEKLESLLSNQIWTKFILFQQILTYLNIIFRSSNMQTSPSIHIYRVYVV